MKYCLNCRQEKAYLQKADEIKVEFRDRKIIPDLIDNYPDATIILMCYSGEEINWNDCVRWNVLAKGNFIMCLSSFEDAKVCKEKELKFYIGYPIKTFYELNALKDLGVCYVRLAEPLFFQMDEVKLFNIPVRVIPNIAFTDTFPHPDGVCGTWIRPEDVDTYAPYVETIEFEDCDNRKEQALYRLYAEQKNWPGNLSMIITNLEYPAVNRMILPDVARSRLNCGQKCQMNRHCKICYRAFDLADPEKIRDYMETTDQS